MATFDPVIFLKYAIAADATYANKPVPLGMEVLDTFESTRTGFAATALRDTTTGQVVISIRGSDDPNDWTGSNLALLQQKIPEQYADALWYFNDVLENYAGNDTSNIIVTGHSLGHSLAQLLGADKNVTAYGYNGPGVLEILQTDPYFAQQFANADPASFTNIFNVNMSFDVASSIGTQLGTVMDIDPTIFDQGRLLFEGGATLANPLAGAALIFKDLIDQHGIDTVIEAMLNPLDTASINGYRYDAATKQWYQTSQDGAVEYASPELSGQLTTESAARAAYNEKLPEARLWVNLNKSWDQISTALQEQYGEKVFCVVDPENPGAWIIMDKDHNYLGGMIPTDDGGYAVGTVDGEQMYFLDNKNLLLNNPSPILTQSVTSVIDALTLLKAIQTGEPLPIVVSGLRLANDLTTLANNGIPYTNLSGAANVGSGILSLMSLNEAIKQGDTLAAMTAGAQTVYFGATAYANFLGYTSDKMGSAVSKALPNSGLGQLGDALPYLSLVNSIAHGDEIGAGVAVVDLALMNAGVYSVPYVGWAYAVYSIVDSLFGGDDEIPDPWGNGHYVWNGTGISYQSAGETGGNEAVSNVMSSVLSTMNALIERERQQNPGSQLGLIPNRMPSMAYDMSGYRYTDIDPLTGAEQHPSLRFDTSGNPYNATPGTPESYQSIVEGMVYSALSRGAIAPLWEVQTAAIQTQYGDPKAGLTEEERAGRDGMLAAPLTGATQIFRPVMLDLDGDGIETVNKAASGVAFDVDDSGFLKATGWATGGDAFLTLDRDYNGETNSGREMFSNSVVDLSRRGLAGMAWVDSNYDGRLTALDPVWNELKVWLDDLMAVEANRDEIEAANEPEYFYERMAA